VLFGLEFDHSVFDFEEVLFISIVHLHTVNMQCHLPHYVKCYPNIANSIPYVEKPLAMHSKLFWTLLMMEIIFPLIEEMKEWIEVMTTPL
jgi:hypothetical protein